MEQKKIGAEKVGHGLDGGVYTKISERMSFEDDSIPFTWEMTLIWWSIWILLIGGLLVTLSATKSSFQRMIPVTALWHIPFFFFSLVMTLVALFSHVMVIFGWYNVSNANFFAYYVSLSAILDQTHVALTEAMADPAINTSPLAILGETCNAFFEALVRVENGFAFALNMHAAAIESWRT